MKKTLVAFLAFSSMAMADATFNFTQADTAATLTGSQCISIAGGTATAVSQTLADGTVLTLGLNGGKLWGASIGSDKVNDTALAELDAFAGTSLATEYTSLKMVGTGSGRNNSTLTLDFSANTQVSANAQKKWDSIITLYALVGSPEQKISGLTLTGLSNATITYAGADGSGFSADYPTLATNNDLVLMKVVGILDASTPLVIQASSSKTAPSLVSYKIVPEPATATLSLLALAGLAARRRRH